MSQRRILGLDLGTNSIGWAIVDRELNIRPYNGSSEKEENFELVDQGVRVFPEGYDKDQDGNDQSKASQRTQTRSARRLKFRKKLRKYHTLKVLIEQEPKWCPLSPEGIEQWKKYKNPDTGKVEKFRHFPKEEAFLNWLSTDEESEKNPYYFRDKFSREKYDWETDPDIAQELGRAFYHMAQRRGFLSNRLDEGDEGEAEQKAAHILQELEKLDSIREFPALIETEFQGVTEEDKDLFKLYNYFQNRIKEIEKGSFDSEESFFQTIKRNLERRLGQVKQEIHELDQKIEENGCKTLGQYFYKLYQGDRHDSENKIRGWHTGREEHYEKEFQKICEVQGIEGELKEKLHKALFYQRPLKSQKGKVGKCSLEKDKPRCPESHPAFEEKRILEFINNIKLHDHDGPRPLEDEEKKAIWPLFFMKSKKKHFSFSDIKNRLEKFHGQKGLDFNYKERTTVRGAPATAELKELFGKDSEAEDYQERTWENILSESLWKKELREHYRGDKKKRERIKKGEAHYEKGDQEKGQKSQEDIVDEVWHVLFNFDDKEKLERFGREKLDLDEKGAENFSKIALPQGYGSLSLKAIRNILPFLQKGHQLANSVFLAKIPDLIPSDIWERYQKTIIEGINDEIERYEKDLLEQRVVNSLLKGYKDHHGPADQEKVLDKYDRKDVADRVRRVFGPSRMEEMAEEEQATLVKETESRFQEQLRKDEFLGRPQLDRRLKDWLLSHDEFGLEEKDLEKLYHPSADEIYPEDIVREVEGKKFLGSPEHPALNNPVVMRTMHQLKTVINALIEVGKIDENTQVHIELARDVNTANMRKAIELYQKRREEENADIKLVLQELFKEQGKTADPSSEDLRKARAWAEQTKDMGESLFEDSRKEQDAAKKYRLWKEQEGICFYTGKQISLSELFDGKSFEVEHTIPRSKSYDNSMENLTVCDSDFNRNEKQDRMPSELSNHEDIKQRIGIWKEKIEHFDQEIENAKKASSSAPTKEAKDRAVQRKHLASFRRDYWREKYDRFVREEIPQGFINKNLVDTGIITKYARAYLATLFNRKKVHCVNGSLVDEFRKAWGLHQTVFNKEGETSEAKKVRDQHSHHAIDAVVIACMTKEKFDDLAHAWRKGEWVDEEGPDRKSERESLEASKPWKNFIPDVKDLEKKILVSHFSRNEVGKQSKRKLRKRGKIQYTLKEELPKEFANKKEGKDYFIVEKDGKKYYKVPIYEQGETIRGSLHKDSFYGAIAQKDEEGNIIKDEDDEVVPEYVIRKELSQLKEGDVKKIVDPVVRQKVEEAKKNGILKFSNAGANKKGEVWMNEEKGVEIKKVRIYSHVKNPVKVKNQTYTKLEQKDKRKKWKEKYYAELERNVAMALYGKDRMNVKSYSLLDTFNYAEIRKYEHGLFQPSIAKGKREFPIMNRNGSDVILKPGGKVLISSVEQINDLSDHEKFQRLYKIIGFENDGRVSLKHHSEAKMDKDLGKGDSSFTNEKEPPSKLRLSPSKFIAFVDGIDFYQDALGNIRPL